MTKMFGDSTRCAAATDDCEAVAVQRGAAAGAACAATAGCHAYRNASWAVGGGRESSDDPRGDGVGDGDGRGGKNPELRAPRLSPPAAPSAAATIVAGSGSHVLAGTVELRAAVAALNGHAVVGILEGYNASVRLLGATLGFAPEPADFEPQRSQAKKLARPCMGAKLRVLKVQEGVGTLVD